ncbi:putative RSN1 [Coleophoma cylindrospora]|uniref:Putative RSN1 n=1 Tax=Coleophoma cylindrospora TaxID=1849047 RepID=A0A3D8SRL3_9HELO|nr:putative RSN1 [Coleophoma cylindrospora]
MDSLKTLVRRDTASGASEFLDLLKDPYSSQIQAGSIYASLGTSIGFSLLIAVLFSLLRPYNSIVYAPKLRVADEKHAPPPMGRGMFAWFGPVVKTTEQDIIVQVGLDATIFLRFLRMCRNIFVVLSIFGCGILIPINLIKGVKYSNSSFISRLTPLYTYGVANWGETICAWIFDIIVCGFLWWNYRKVLFLRRQYYDSPEYHASLHARTLMINDIPKDFRSDEGIGRLIDEVAPTSSFARSAVARNVKDLPELIEEHNGTVRELEKVLAKYLKDPANLPAARPTCKPSKKDPSFASYPKGQKLDAIDYLTNRIKELEIEVKEVRLTVDKRNPLPYGFASYEAIDEAHHIAYTARRKHPQGTTIVLAPRPNDIIWKNMPLNKKQRKWRRMVNNLWVILLTIVWIAPNALISIFLVSLSNLGHVWPAFQTSLSAHTVWWSIVQGVASPAITSLIYLVLPIIFRRLAIRAGDRTKTARERHVTGKLYTFFVINFLVVFSVFSVIWTFISNVLKSTGSGTNAWKAIQDANIGLQLFIALCDLSPFWVTWLLQRNLGAAVDLAQLWTLVYSFCARKLSSPTPREMIELSAPPAFEYAAYYNYLLFYSTVALCFGTVQPLVLVAAAFYFSVDIYLKKYLLIYIFITKTESGGMFWRMLFNRMVFATILSNCVVFLSVWAQGDGQHIQAYSVVPLPFLMLAFKFYCKKTYDDKIHYYSVRGALKDPETSRSKLFGGKGDRLAARFGHPALYRPLITPMVHAKAQNILASVYRGRLTDGNTPGSVDNESISGYSDTYALDPMRVGQPGRKRDAVPGFEMVPENKLDFSYYKGRAEFGEEHGGGGNIYGKADDLVRPDTPSTMVGGEGSRPGTPVQGRRDFTGSSMGPPATFDTYGDIGNSHSMYAQRNDSENSLVHGAAAMPVTSPAPRDNSLDRRAPGFLGGGPQGYGGLPQVEEDDLQQNDPMNYDYFRARRNNGGWQGWS